MEFTQGDVVRLKSGGPDMTVEEIDAQGNVICVWFQGSLVKRQGFAAALLLKPNRGGMAFYVPKRGAY
jgi:uncharacterized protein YodC (DUF2158 family)